MCCSGPRWKREVVPDHKFDFIDTRDFHSDSFGIRLQYVWVYILVIKSFLVYISDIYTATTMLTSTNWANKIFTSCPDEDGCVAIPFNIAKWLFVGCIIFSFLLLAYEAHKAKKIIASRDISFAYTNVMAQNYYSLRSYDHFCFFCHINDSTKKKDDFAFFIFFTFKGWKRLLLADGPRQTINALTLYSFYLSKRAERGEWYDLNKYFDKRDMVTNGLLVAITFTVIIFAGSLLLLIAAAILYVPLLCYIQGNLKEYCCHKVDKRISELINRRRKQRIAKAAQLAKKEAAGDFSHLKGMPQPTLPTISLDDDEDLKKPLPGQRSYAASVRTANDSYWEPEYKNNDHHGAGGTYAPDYPPMPAYDPTAYPPQPGYAAYNVNLHGQDDSTLYDYENDRRPLKHNSGSQEPPSASTYSHDRYATPDPYGRNGSIANTNSNRADSVYGGYDSTANQNVYGGYNVTQQQQQQMPWDEAPAYQADPYQRTPSRNLPSRNTSRWADGGGGAGAGGQQQGGYGGGYAY